jgi:hypothetical protein
VEAAESGTFLCVICGDRGTADALLNLALFLPLGILLGAVGRGIVVALALGVVLSAGIEGVQLFLPGRFPTLGDLVWNGVGAAAGAASWLAIRRTTLSTWASPWTGRTAALLVVAVIGATGALLEPRWTQDRYWGQWTPDLGHLEHYRGQVLEAGLDDLPIPPGVFPEVADPRAALEGPWDLSARVVKGAPPRDIASIVSIYDGHQREIVLLGAQGEDLVWRERTFAKALLLDHPDLRFPAALGAHATGDTVMLAVRRVGGERCLEVSGTERCGLGFTAGRAWGLLMYPEGFGTRWGSLLDAVWMGLLLLPVGGLSRSLRSLAANAGLVAVGWGLATVTTRILFGPWTEVVGASCGCVLGWVAGRWLSSSRRGALGATS